MVSTAVQARPTQSVWLSYDPRDNRAVQFLASIRLLDFFHVEESPYDQTYVAEVKAMDKSTFKTMKSDDLWK